MTEDEEDAEAKGYVSFPAHQNPTINDIVEELDNLINIDDE